MSEELDHVLVRFGVEVMDLVTSVKDISHGIRWCRVDYGTRYYIKHISVVSIFGQAKLGVREKSANSSKMNISTA
jgi:hypothetical protein